MNILALLHCLTPCLTATTLRQFSLIALALLTMTGRVTMTGIARWSEPVASYRTIQRFFATRLPWAGFILPELRSKLPDWRRYCNHGAVFSLFLT